jgi:hypothetical protein
MEKTAPPNLVSLTAIGDMVRQRGHGAIILNRHESQTHWLLDASTSIDSLQDVTIITTKAYDPMTVDHTDTMKHLGKAFESRNVHLHILSRRSRGAIPPILYGECDDKETLEYESEGDRVLNMSTVADSSDSYDEDSSDHDSTEYHSSDEDVGFMDEVEEGGS